MRKTILSRRVNPTHSTFYAGSSFISIKSCLTALVSALIFIIFCTQSAHAITYAEYAVVQHNSEHKAVQDLVPVSASHRQVIKSGPWSNPATWSGKQLPKAGENLHVPKDKTLLVNVSNNFSIGKLRVDGNIKFVNNMKVKLKLDTLVVTETGSIEIGSENSRIPANRSVEIIIANNGPINRTLDPKNLSRGVIIMGKSRIFGMDKSPFHKLASHPAAGATQITLASPPTGWAKDDLIVVTATQYRPKQKGDARHITQDELRKISSISGNVVTLGKVDNSDIADPLEFSHVPAIANMPVYAANLTRNVVISGEDGESVPPSQRGHFAVMHNPDTIIKGAGFYYLGRTDKSKPLDDYKLGVNSTRLKDAKGNAIPGPNNNPRGRYAVHFHHTGVSDAANPPAIFSGNAVFSSAGWGVVNHTSHVQIENNASYNVLGSHYVSEDGNELGTFKNNIAIKSEGRYRAYVKYGQNNHDMGHTGHGFWLESRNLAVEGNVISGVTSSGIVYWHRNYTPGTFLWIPRKNLLTADKDLIKNAPAIFYEKIPIRHEKNNTVLASGGTMDIIKGFAKQNHDVRNVIDSLKGYSVISGVNIDYSENYTIKNLELYADPVTRKWHHGLLIATQVTDVVVANSKINGFVHPVITGTSIDKKPTEAIFANVTVDDRPLKPTTDIHKRMLDIAINYNPAYQRVVNSPGLNPGVTGKNLPNLVFKKGQSPNFPVAFNQAYVIEGIKHDSLGQIPYRSSWLDKQLLETVRKGYYKDALGAKYVFLPEIISDRLTGETRIMNIKLKFITWYKDAKVDLGPLP